jgi:hypothetical protein
MLKTIFQVSIIVLSKTAGKSDFNAHAVTYLLAVIIYLLLNLRMRAFNYDVLWTWHVATLVGVFWLAFLNFCDSMTDSNVVFVILLFSGWAIIAITA